MCFKKILEKSSEKVADITCLAGDISDLIMVSLIANHKCTSISFDTAEFSDRKIKSIKKYKRKVNRLYKEDFVIQRNNILIKNKNIENVKPFIKERIISAIPPLDFDNNDTEKFFKRYISNESYPDKVLKLFDYFTNQICNFRISYPNPQDKLQLMKFKNLILFENLRGWQKIFTELVFDKLKSESIVTNYFKDAELIKNNSHIFDFNRSSISLIKVEDNEIKITDTYQKNKLIFMPYLMIWITKFMPVTLQLNLIYSSLIN